MSLGLKTNTVQNESKAYRFVNCFMMYIWFSSLWCSGVEGSNT